MARAPSDIIVDQVKERLSNPLQKKDPSNIDPNRLVSCGSSLLNLASSGHARGAFEMGDMVTIPGASTAGKTILALSALASAAYNPMFQGYELIMDDVENALRFDIARLFGERAYKRIRPPDFWEGDIPKNSNTIQEAKCNILKLCQQKKPFIYVVDSLDALTCVEEVERSFKEAIEMAKDPDERKALTGSYNTEKAKQIHEMFRLIKDDVAYYDSIVLFTQQLKQNFGAGPFAPKYRTSGGEGPFFWSSIQIWMTKLGTIKDKKFGRKIGAETKADVRKNKLNGKLREASFNIYYDYGIDDTGSMIDFLVEEKFWKKSGQEVIAEELGLKGTRPKTTGELGTLVYQIEEKKMRRQLCRVVEEAWNSIEESLKLNLPPKFGDEEY